MYTIFMNSENSRTSEYHALVLKLTDSPHLLKNFEIQMYYQNEPTISNKNYGKNCYFYNFVFLPPFPS